METLVVAQERRWLPLLGWGVALGGALAVFHSLGSGALAAPPAPPDGWAGWAEGRDPLVATVAVLRLVVLGLGWYLLATTVVGVVARLLRAARLVAVADAVTIPVVRGLLRNALGVSLATALIAAPVGVAQPSRAHASSGPTVLDVLPVHAPGEAGAGGVAALLPDVASEASADASPEGAGAAALPLPLELASDPDPVVGDAPGSAVATSPPVAADVQPASDARDGATVTVAAGDSLWSIARAALVADGRAPGESEVAVYWTAVVEQNRPMLADPANPDLIFPGDTIVLPGLPERVEVP